MDDNDPEFGFGTRDAEINSILERNVRAVKSARPKGQSSTDAVDVLTAPTETLLSTQLAAKTLRLAPTTTTRTVSSPSGHSPSYKIRQMMGVDLQLDEDWRAPAPAPAADALCVSPVSEHSSVYSQDDAEESISESEFDFDVDGSPDLGPGCPAGLWTGGARHDMWEPRPPAFVPEPLRVCKASCRPVAPATAVGTGGGHGGYRHPGPAQLSARPPPAYRLLPASYSQRNSSTGFIDYRHDLYHATTAQIAQGTGSGSGSGSGSNSQQAHNTAGSSGPSLSYAWVASRAAAERRLRPQHPSLPRQPRPAPDSHKCQSLVRKPAPRQPRSSPWPDDRNRQAPRRQERQEYYEARPREFAGGLVFGNLNTSGGGGSRKHMRPPRPVGRSLAVIHDDDKRSHNAATRTIGTASPGCGGTSTRRRSTSGVSWFSRRQQKASEASPAETSILASQQQQYHYYRYPHQPCPPEDNYWPSGPPQSGLPTERLPTRSRKANGPATTPQGVTGPSRPRFRTDAEPPLNTTATAVRSTLAHRTGDLVQQVRAAVGIRTQAERRRDALRGRIHVVPGPPAIRTEHSDVAGGPSSLRRQGDAGLLSSADTNGTREVGSESLVLSPPPRPPRQVFVEWL